MAKTFTYTNAEHTQVRLDLEGPDDQHGNYIGPMTNIGIGMAPGNREFDALFTSASSEFDPQTQQARLIDLGEPAFPINPYVAPPIPFQNEISRRQFYQQAEAQGIIDEDEMVDALGGKIPTVLLNKVNTFPAAQRIEAKALLAGATVFKFDSPYTLTIGALMEPPMDADAMRAYWVAASKLV